MECVPLISPSAGAAGDDRVPGVLHRLRPTADEFIEHLIDATCRVRCWACMLGNDRSPTLCGHDL